jgi:hypothetical protein
MRNLTVKLSTELGEFIETTFTFDLIHKFFEYLIAFDDASFS